MPGDLPLTLRGEPLVLLPEHALFRPHTVTLYVADTHWGKPAAFRASGIAVPGGTTRADLVRLAGAVRRVDATHLVVLGDLLHARLGRTEPDTLAAIADWRAELDDVRVTLVRGNHDRAAGDPDPAWRIDIVEDPHPDPPFTLRHVPHARADEYFLAGHEHPAVRLTGGAGERFKLPAFRVGEHGLTLPAFSGFADGGTIPPAARRAGLRGGGRGGAGTGPGPSPRRRGFPPENFRESSRGRLTKRRGRVVFPPHRDPAPTATSPGGRPGGDL